MKSNSTKEIICVQVDYSENFWLGTQNAYYSQEAVSLFKSHVWCSGGGQSYIYASKNLIHYKYCIRSSLDNLSSQVKQQFQDLEEIHVFSHGALQQFKQNYLFGNI